MSKPSGEFHDVLYVGALLILALIGYIADRLHVRWGGQPSPHRPVGWGSYEIHLGRLGNILLLMCIGATLLSVLIALTAVSPDWMFLPCVLGTITAVLIACQLPKLWRGLRHWSRACLRFLDGRSTCTPSPNAGDMGLTVTPVGPIGAGPIGRARFGDRIISVVTQGEFIERPGVPVRVIRRQAGHMLVVPAAPPVREETDS